MFIIKSLIFFSSYIGIFGLTVIIIYKYLWASLYECFRKKNIQNNTVVLFFSICWFTTLGLTGVISSLFFYLNLPNNYARLLLFLIGFVGIPYIFIARNNLKELINTIKYKKIIQTLLFKEKIIILVILFIYLIFLYKSLIPWFDNDEITQYGYFTKLASNGWTISDHVFGGFTRFAEVMYAPFFWVTESTFLPRIIRSTGIIFNALTIYCVCRFLSASRFTSFLGSAAFLVTPELAVIGVSMKTDVVLLGFELMGLLLFSLAIFSINFNGLLKIKFPKYINKILLFSILFCMLAMASRSSGLYSLILVTLIGIPIIILNSKNSYIIFKYIFFLAIAAIFIFTGLIYNFINYFNPLYPFGGHWLIFFPGGEFDPSWDLRNNYRRNLYNIDIGIPILNDFYIIIYHALGFEDEKYASLNLPARPDGAASGWLNPILLIIFLTPFYFHKSKEILITFTSFIFLYILWVNGLQYSRIFVAASSLTILIAIKIITLDYISKIGKIIKKSINYLIIIVIIVFSYYHIQSARYYNPYGFKLLFNEEAIFNSNARRALSVSLWHLFDDTDKERLLAKKELSKSINYIDYINLKKIISSFKKPLIIFNTLAEINNIHILFNKGYFINLKNIDSKKVSDAMNKLKFSNNKSICLLTNAKSYNSMNSVFVNILYQSEKKLTLRCR